MTFPLVALVILDGWGIAPPGPGNAIELADTPVFDRLWRDYPHTELGASGEAVGLPAGQMGNSEVGHLTIGSGRVLDQDLQRVNRAVARRRPLRQRGARLGLPARARPRRQRPPARARLDTAASIRTSPTSLRCSSWRSARAWPTGRGSTRSPTVATSRRTRPSTTSRRFPRTGSRASRAATTRWTATSAGTEPSSPSHAIVTGHGAHAADPVAAVQASYDAGVTDEFVVPVVIDGRPRLDPGRDAAIFFNFRPDRTRQLSEKLGELRVDLTTMTHYRDDFDFPVAFPEQSVAKVLAEVLADHGLRQLHTAETEKYAHVTYFFNGGREEEFPGETRILVPSPRDVPSYDHKPSMSANEVADRFVAEIGDGGYAFAVLNFANPDMVGHTGVIPAAVIEAVETADACLGRVVEAVSEAGGVCLITADHGNAEKMFEDDGVSPHTAHTTNPVPLILTEKGATLRPGELSDLAPTALALLGVEQPSEMTGQDLVNPA